MHKIEKNILSTKLAIFLSIASITACGGGGGGDSGLPGYGDGENITYISHNGLKWSSPSSATFIYGQLFVTSILEPQASAYCSQSLSTNGGPSLPSNFNKEVGWSIPTTAQIMALRSAIPKPPGWPMVDLWVEPLQSSQLFVVYTKYINFGTGLVTLPNATAKAHVVCVKPI